LIKVLYHFLCDIRLEVSQYFLRSHDEKLLTGLQLSNHYCCGVLQLGQASVRTVPRDQVQTWIKLPRSETGSSKENELDRSPTVTEREVDRDEPDVTTSQSSRPSSMRAKPNEAMPPIPRRSIQLRPTNLPPMLQSRYVSLAANHREVLFMYNKEADPPRIPKGKEPFIYPFHLQTTLYMEQV
jgi:hypothetical protein